MKVNHHGMAQGIRDIAGCDGNPSASAIERCNGRGGLGLVRTMISDSSNRCLDGAAQAIARWTLNDLFILDTILLSSKCVKDRGRRVDLSVRGSCEVQPARPDVETNILQAKGVSSDVVPVNSPGRKRKKKAIMIMSAMASSGSLRWLPLACERMYMMIRMGIGLTRFGGASSFLYARSCRWIRKSMPPWPSLRGSRPPSLACAWPTARSASSTVRDLTGFLRGARRPSRYRSPKTCRLGTGSAQFLRYGSMLCAIQNESQRLQWLSMALAR
jgi:hypothetical protein